MNDPITIGCQRRVKEIEQDVLRMGALVEKSFRLSHKSLFSRNLVDLTEIKALDKQIDQFYRQIESDCANMMTSECAKMNCYRHLSAFMQLVRDLERIGDYAKDLTEIAIQLLPYPQHPVMSEIEIMSHHAQAMLASSLEALADLDAQAGKNVKVKDNEVDQAYKRVYQTIAYQRDIKGVVEPYVLLGLLIRHLERMADHATNIGQRVAYIVTGTRD